MYNLNLISTGLTIIKGTFTLLFLKTLFGIQPAFASPLKSQGRINLKLINNR